MFALPDVRGDGVCAICGDGRRDQGLLCVVETPADVIAIEESGSFRGRYFVLLGRLSPLDGIGPDQLGIPLLQAQLGDGLRELIIASSATVEGEATAAYLASIARGRGIRATRIAHGVPMGNSNSSTPARFPMPWRRERPSVGKWIGSSCPDFLSCPGCHEFRGGELPGKATGISPYSD